VSVRVGNREAKVRELIGRLDLEKRLGSQDGGRGVQGAYEYKNATRMFTAEGTA
jgi:hypothetical protein